MYCLFCVCVGVCMAETERDREREKQIKSVDFADLHLQYLKKFSFGLDEIIC